MTMNVSLPVAAVEYEADFSKKLDKKRSFIREDKARLAVEKRRPAAVVSSNNPRIRAVLGIAQLQKRKLGTANRRSKLGPTPLINAPRNADRSPFDSTDENVWDVPPAGRTVTRASDEYDESFIIHPRNSNQARQ